MQSGKVIIQLNCISLRNSSTDIPWKLHNITAYKKLFSCKNLISNGREIAEFWISIVTV